MLYTLHTFARYNRKELAAIATSFRSFVSGKVFSTAGTKAEFFPLSSSFFFFFFRLNYHFARKAAARVWRTNRAIIFLPEHFSKLLSGFVLSFVTRATVGPRPVYQLYRLAIPAPIHPLPRNIRSYAARFFLLFLKYFRFGEERLKSMIYTLRLFV